MREGGKLFSLSSPHAPPKLRKPLYPHQIFAQKSWHSYPLPFVTLKSWAEFAGLQFAGLHFLNQKKMTQLHGERTTEHGQRF